MKRLFILLILIGAILYVAAAQKEPTNDREWWPYYAKTPDAEVDGEIVTLTNVRNWNHNLEEVISDEWIDEVVISTDEIKQVWFGYSGFSKIPVLGHTFLSFELEDGSAYTFSVEARREQDEEYSAFKGIFNAYELWYGWGTERDFVGVRVFMLNQPIEFYPLNLNKAESQALFMTFAEKTHSVAENPQFYNTITSNCTNELARAIEAKYPDRISYDLAQNLPGLSVAYLERIGFLTPKNRFTIPKYNKELQQTIEKTPRDFSVTLREVLKNIDE